MKDSSMKMVFITGLSNPLSTQKTFIPRKTLMSVKEYTDKQRAFLAALPTTKGNIRESMDQAGYSKATTVTEVVSGLKDEIIEITKDMLVINGPFAAMSLVEVLMNPAEVGTNQKLMAVKEILDRIGVIKEDKMTISTDGGGLFILPAKVINIPDDSEIN